MKRLLFIYIVLLSACSTTNKTFEAPDLSKTIWQVPMNEYALKSLNFVGVAFTAYGEFLIPINDGDTYRYHYEQHDKEFFIYDKTADMKQVGKGVFKSPKIIVIELLLPNGQTKTIQLKRNL